MHYQASYRLIHVWEPISGEFGFFEPFFHPVVLTVSNSSDHKRFRTRVEQKRGASGVVLQDQVTARNEDTLSWRTVSAKDSSLPRLYIRAQMSIKRFALDRHINLIEGILHDIIRIELVHLADDDVHVGLVGFGEEEEFGARQGLEALQTEMVTLQGFQAGGGRPRNVERVEACGNRMNPADGGEGENQI